MLDKNNKLEIGIVKMSRWLNGYKKKNKLDLPGLSPEVVGEWIKSKLNFLIQNIGGRLISQYETVSFI